MSYVIDRLDDLGRGITSVDGKTCFVSNALPQEEVEIEIVGEKKKYLDARAINIKECNDRREPICPFFLECGGCNIMHMKYDMQLKFKENKVKNILNKFASISNVVKDIIPSKEISYRNKVILKVKDGKIGFFKDKTHDLISIDKCLLCKESINRVIKILNNYYLSNIEEVLIRSNYKDEILLCFKGSKIDKNLYDIDVDNIVIVENNKKKIIKGNDFFIDKIGNKLFKVSIDSFFQVNYIAVEELYKIVLEYASLTGKEKVLDLYCGTGTIGIFLSENAKNVYGIEINKSAVDDANYNKELNKISNIDFVCNDVGHEKRRFNNVDLVVIDPPRSGLDNFAINNIVAILPKKIIYVSCDPVTLARDLNILKEKYQIKKVIPVDMFPNTYHVECVCLLMKKKS